ncbi:MAG TPA: hypothetical protein VK327_07380 [Candidatus Paceibacterota bacterium]|nr:hypothetical protein [Candidatus Paceibacterota bacterium]
MARLFADVPADAATDENVALLLFQALLFAFWYDSPFGHGPIAGIAGTISWGGCVLLIFRIPVVAVPTTQNSEQKWR